AVPSQGMAESLSLRLSRLRLDRLMRVIRIVLGLAVLIATTARSHGQASDAGSLEFFEKKIRPVLVEHCYKCHSSEAKKLKGGLRLDSRAGLLKGGDSGPAIVPGNPGKSRLIEAVTYKNVDLQMPPKGKLPDAIVADLTKWIERGAMWPAQQTATDAKSKDGFDLQKRKRDHWAWQPIQLSTPPVVRDTAWAQSPVDAFVLARIEAKGLKPAQRADRRTLLRRVTFDLIGLPPTPEEITAFLEDDSADAFSKVVDRLLDSPRFGERWARHWL